MKGGRASLLVIVGLSIAVWLFYYNYSDAARLNAEETLFVVLACTVLVLGGRQLWGRLQKLWRRGNGQ
jgi:hypothetical protein